MKKNLYISIFILSLLIFGCQNNSEFEKLNSYYQTQISDEHPVSEIDFSKRKSELVKDIENQIGIDLCEDGLITGKTEYKSNEIRFPAYILKSCENFVSIHGVVEVRIGTDNGAIVYDELVGKNQSVSDKILKATSEMMQKKGRNIVLYSIDWEENTNPKFVKQRLTETLKTVKSYSNSISKKVFGKNIEELNQTELDELNGRFSMKIGFDDYEMPPKPPMPKDTIE